MDSSLTELAAGYKRRYGTAVLSREGLRGLYGRYVKGREASILDAAAATAALNVLAFGDQIDTGAITPQMQEAYRLAFSILATRMTLAERLIELGDSSDDVRRGFLNSLKGKYFEVIVKDRFNAGLTTGDLVPGLGQTAQLATDPTQPGWDLRIVNADGSTNELLQLKAADSFGPIRGALVDYPEFRVLATDEGVTHAVDNLVNSKRLLRSGISGVQLGSDVAAPVEPMLETQLEDLLETVAPGLPFVLIGLGEGIKVMMGKQAFQEAAHRSLDRATKTGAAMAVGRLAMLVGAGVISLPAAFLTRIGIDRYRIHAGLSRQLSANTESIRALSQA